MNDYNLNQLFRTPVHRTYRSATGVNYGVTEKHKYPRWLWILALIILGA